MRDDATVLDIVLACRRIEQFIADYDDAAFLKDVRTQWAVASQFTLIGEAAKRLSQDFRDQYSLIPWLQIMGMRDRVVHGTTRSIGSWFGQRPIAMFQNCYAPWSRLCRQILKRADPRI
jgi:uncharacterized protein with HEPN domain